MQLNAANKLRKVRNLLPLYVMLIPCVVLLLVFSYVPMAGVVIAFKNLNPRLGMFASPWAEPVTKYFRQLFTDQKFWDVLVNTLYISFLRLLAGFPAPIILALMYNEIRHDKFKRVTQTVLYLPHFLSWVVLSGIFQTIFLNEGSLNVFLHGLGLESIPFLTKREYFVPFLVVTDVWKGMGFGSIVYLAAISGIDAELYESAELDGAGRLQKMWYITLPNIAMAISVNLILSMSGILSGGFDQIYNLDATGTVFDIIDTYLYRIAFSSGSNYGLATALGLFKSLVSLLLILVTNKAANKISGVGIW